MALYAHWEAHTEDLRYTARLPYRSPLKSSVWASEDAHKVNLRSGLKMLAPLCTLGRPKRDSRVQAVG